MGLYLGGKKIGNGNNVSLVNEQVKECPNVDIIKVNKSYVSAARYKQFTLNGDSSGTNTLKYQFSSTNIYVCDDLYSISNATKITVDDIQKFSFEDAYISYYFPSDSGVDNYQCIKYDENKFDISYSVTTSNYVTYTLTLLCSPAELPGFTNNPNPRIFGIIGILKYDGKYVLFGTSTPFRVIETNEYYFKELSENNMSYGEAPLLLPIIKEMDKSKLSVISRTLVYSNNNVVFSSATETNLYFYTIYFGSFPDTISSSSSVSFSPNINYDVNGETNVYSNSNKIVQKTYRRLNNA